MSAMFTDAVLMRSLILFLLLGSIVGFFAAIMLLLRADWMLGISKFRNRWISTRKIGISLNPPVNIDNWFYRNGHVSGAVLLAGAIYIVYILTTQVVRADLLLSIGSLQLVHAALLEPLLDTLVLIFLASALCLVTVFITNSMPASATVIITINMISSIRLAPRFV